MKKEEHIKNIIDAIPEEHKENLIGFFTDAKGTPPALKNHFYEPLHKAGEHVRKRVERYNKTHGASITKADIYSVLGAEQTLLTHPSERRIIQGLVDLIFNNLTNGKKEYEGLTTDNELYQDIKSRAYANNMKITEYMEAINFPWQGTNWSREKLMQEVVKKKGAINLESLPDNVQHKLKHAAKEDGTRIQNLIIESSNGESYLSGEQRISVETPKQAIAIIQKRFDKILKGIDGENSMSAGKEQPPLPITATLLKEHGLYDWLKHKRDALGIGTKMSIAAFINTALTGYSYTGKETTQIVDRSNEHGLKAVTTTADTVEK